MEKAQRRALLRLRHRALGGLPYQVAGKGALGARTLPLPNGGAGKPLAVFYGAALCDKRTEWVTHPDHKPCRPKITPKCKARVSALTKIAQKWGTPEWCQKRGGPLIRFRQSGLRNHRRALS
jgi:hypothetical protein